MTDQDKNLEATEETVDPRLDNRTGRRRPPLETFPAKPQQIDGPSLTDTVPTPKQLAKAEENDGVVRKGMSSPGPHGLGETEVVPFDEAVSNPEKAVTAEDKGKSASEVARTNVSKPVEKKEAK